MSDWGIMVPDMVIGFIAGAMVALVALGLGATIAIPGMDRWSKSFFIVLFSDYMLLMGIYFLEAMLYGHPELILAEQVVYLIESMIIAIPLPMFMVYLLHSCNEDMRNSAPFRATVILSLAFLAIGTLSLFTDLFYTITPENTFIRERWYPLLIVPLAVIMVLNLVGTIQRRDKLSKRYLRAFLVYLLPLTIAMIIHMFSSVFLLIDIGVAISALSMYIIILTDQIEQYLRQQQEIAHQRASITVLQMRPHFIYNTMTSIYYLCKVNPDKAQQVTMDFTTYLRRNFSAVASDSTIPFSEELDHTHAYLAVEQAQFEDMLRVDYDVQYTQFRVPPLTLQPVVENAVKHGLDPDSDPLHVIIQTRATASSSIIVVKDNGSGFDSAIADDPSTTLANIRQRLKMMCDGKLDIVSRVGFGTVATITIPIRDNEKAAR